MEFVQTPECTHSFGAPKDWDHDTLPCAVLPLQVTEVNGLPCLKSWWKPTPEEIKLLIEGGAFVCLHIVGTGMPPVMLSVET